MNIITKVFICLRYLKYTNSTAYGINWYKAPGFTGLFRNKDHDAITVS